MIHSTQFDILASSSFDFYLTGSRFFNTASPSSDWDFFTEESREVNNWLQDNGFKLVKSHYRDALAGKVYILKNIHVQVVKDARIKLHAQNIISKHILYTFEKSQMRMVWDAVIAALGEAPYDVTKNQEPSTPAA